jgi:hypothetical protein
MNNSVNPDPNTLLATVGGGRMTRFYTRPVVGILFGLWTYLCCLYVAALAPRILATGGTREIVVLTLPLLTLLLLVCIIYSVYRASDEYLRQRILRSAAHTGVILAFSASLYFSLERLGLPQLSMMPVILYGWAVFTSLLLWALYRSR